MLMSRRLESTILINKPAEDVFAFINIPENHTKFVPGMLEFKKTTPGPLGQVGASVRGVRKFLWRKWELPYEITEAEPGNRLGMKGRMGPLAFRDGYILEKMGSDTRVRFWVEPMLTGLMKLAKPLIELMGRAHATETLTNLKKALERTR
jgi:carbon monoxide dehydrogenase subunit G